MRFPFCVIFFFVAASLFAGNTPRSQARKHVAARTQTQPNPERIAEIQFALKAHGYEPGTSWEETREVCRKIADEHMWQTDHAPDARVLILLGLAGPHSDPAVAQMPGGRLDKDQRTEATRRSLNPSAATAESALKSPAQIQKRKTAAVRSKAGAKKKSASRYILMNSKQV